MANSESGVGVRSQGGPLSDRDVQLSVDWLTREGDVSRDEIGKLSDPCSNELKPYRVAAIARVAP